MNTSLKVYAMKSYGHNTEIEIFSFFFKRRYFVILTIKLICWQVFQVPLALFLCEEMDL